MVNPVIIAYIRFERSGQFLGGVAANSNLKRAVEVAAAAAHNLFMSEPQDSGQSMIAERLPTILPPITLAEVIETTEY